MRFIALYHNGGRLRIGPDGMLYITTGDARNPALSRDLNSPAGKILRYNPDGSIPSDNPNPESPVWVSGLRNCQGIDWRADGRMVLTDHGPSGDTNRFGHDEINVVEPGDDLGWPDIYACESSEGLRSPSMTWSDALPPGGHAIYTGTEIPEWQGDVLIGVMGFTSPDQPHLHRIRLSDDGNVTLSETYLRENMGVFEMSSWALMAAFMSPPATVMAEANVEMELDLAHRKASMMTSQIGEHKKRTTGKRKPQTICEDIVWGFKVAPQPGLEPGTCGLTVRRSNQLSY